MGLIFICWLHRAQNKAWMLPGCRFQSICACFVVVVVVGTNMCSKTPKQQTATFMAKHRGSMPIMSRITASLSKCHHWLCAQVQGSWSRSDCCVRFVSPWTRKASQPFVSLETRTSPLGVQKGSRWERPAVGDSSWPWRRELTTPLVVYVTVKSAVSLKSMNNQD